MNIHLSAVPEFITTKYEIVAVPTSVPTSVGKIKCPILSVSNITSVKGIKI